MSRRQTKEHQEDIAPGARDLKGRLRRMAIKLTSKALWQLLGHKTEDGTETVDVEVFPGIGFYARPKTSDRAEAVVVHVGGAKNPAIVATRNEDVRKNIAQLGADETAMFNSQATVHVVGGQVHIRTAGGTAVSLARYSDLAALASSLNTHVHPLSGLPGFTGVSPIPFPSGSPTSVLKGE